MIQKQFPQGESIETDVYIPNKLGCYRVEDIVFGNHPDYFKDFPEKTNKGLDWHSSNLSEAYLTSIDIKRIKRNGGTMKIKEGVYWDKTYNPFQFLLDFTNEKQRQDTLKGTIEYNEAMRTVCKLCPNSLYGKMMERSKNYTYKLYDNFNDLDHSEIDYQKVGYTNGKYVVKEASDSSKSPLQLGIFILGYARDKIMNYADMIGRDKIYGLETDSISTDYINIKPIQDSIDPNYKIGIELGQMEIENKTISDLIVCGKKCYGAKYIGKDGKENYKLRFKGVPSYKLTFDIYIELLEKKTYTFNDIVLFIRELYTNEKTRILIGNRDKTITLMEHSLN